MNHQQTIINPAWKIIPKLDINKKSVLQGMQKNGNTVSKYNTSKCSTASECGLIQAGTSHRQNRCKIT